VSQEPRDVLPSFLDDEYAADCRGDDDPRHGTVEANCGGNAQRAWLGAVVVGAIQAAGIIGRSSVALSTIRDRACIGFAYSHGLAQPTVDRRVCIMSDAFFLACRREDLSQVGMRRYVLDTIINAAVPSMSLQLRNENRRRDDGFRGRRRRVDFLLSGRRAVVVASHKSIRPTRAGGTARDLQETSRQNQALHGSRGATQVKGGAGTRNLIAGTIGDFAIRTKHLDTRLTGLIHADANPRMAVGVGYHQIRVLVFIGQRDALNALT
jgi:hypothetical protein